MQRGIRILGSNDFGMLATINESWLHMLDCHMLATVALIFRLYTFLYIPISFYKYSILSLFPSHLQPEHCKLHSIVASPSHGNTVSLHQLFHVTFSYLFLAASQQAVVPAIQVIYCQETTSHRCFHRCRIWNNPLRYPRKQHEEIRNKI